MDTIDPLILSRALDFNYGSPKIYDWSEQCPCNVLYLYFAAEQGGVVGGESIRTESAGNQCQLRSHRVPSATLRDLQDAKIREVVDI
jgi:hypothetical protein